MCRGELFEPAKAGDHALRLGDLQGGWPLSHWLSSAGADLQSVLQPVTYPPSATAVPCAATYNVCITWP